MYYPILRLSSQLVLGCAKLTIKATRTMAFISDLCFDFFFFLKNGVNNTGIVGKLQRLSRMLHGKPLANKCKGEHSRSFHTALLFHIHIQGVLGHPRCMHMLFRAQISLAHTPDLSIPHFEVTLQHLTLSVITCCSWQRD